jgi:small subunit ribosomal protein S21|tara:strand:- start:100 stop:381 length:282 start_codon:yes stop_codon:yes gene_type:complete
MEVILRKNFNNNRKNDHTSFSSNKSGLTVEVRNGDFTKALRIFKKKVQEAGIIQEYRDRQEYVKPSEKRAKQKAAGRARWLKKLSKDKQDRGY